MGAEKRASAYLVDVDLNVTPPVSRLVLALKQPQRRSLLVLPKRSYQVARLQAHF